MNELQEQNKPDANTRKSFTSRHAVSIKIIVTGILILLLLIPVSMVESLIRERDNTATEAMNEVQEKWSGPQTIAGPILTIPYYASVEKEDRTEKKVKKFIHILPESLHITGNIKTEELKRGLYEVIVYNAPIGLSGQFTLSELLSEHINADDLLLSEASVNIGITDLHGIREQVQGTLAGHTMLFNPGIDNDLLTSGVSTPINLTGLNTDTVLPFDLKLQLKGSGSMLFAPIGKTTTTEITSDCVTPSFTGTFLPEKREITENGFSSSWKVLHLNRNFPQVLTGDKWQKSIQESVFGVNLLLPVDQYQKSTRSVKYAFLIIILTFVVCFFVEILQKKNIHPFQYLLIGLALCLFYTLLIAISEHLSFTISYTIASAMTILLITFYLSGILKVRKTAIIIGALLLCLYIYVFILIQMENFALLVGSIGLFAILAVIMYYSQKINWSNTNTQNPEKQHE